MFSFFTSMSWTLATVSLCILVACISRSKLVALISGILNIYFQRKYLVRHIEHGTRLPSEPYLFPNGQGDLEKFLRGRDNSFLWEKKHGPIYRIWSGSKPEVVVTRPEHIREIFKDSDKHIKAHNNNSGYFLGELLGKCVGLVSRDEWKTLRSVTEQAFVRSKATTYVAQVERKTVEHFEHLLQQPHLSRGIIDPAKDLKMLPFWIVAEIMYGRLSPDMERELEEMAGLREMIWHENVIVNNGLSRFSWSRYLPTKANQELRQFKAKWESFNRQAYSRAVQAGLTDVPIIDMFCAVDSGEVGLESTLHTLDESLFANLDVTLGGISWNLTYLAAHPEIQDQLRQEATTRSTRPTDETSAFETYVTSSSTLLASCVSESSRLRPLAAFSVPQATPTARVVGGYYFPANTNFIVDAYAVNQRNVGYWGADAEQYRPQRFLEAAGGSARVKDRYNFWRFGFGPRQCMGKYVADIIIRVLLVHLVSHYELGLLKTEADDEWARDSGNWINHPLMQISCRKRDDA